MNRFIELLKDEKFYVSLMQIKKMAEKEGLTIDEFIAMILPILNADVKITEQDVKDYFAVKSGEVSDDELDNVVGGCGESSCCDSWNEHCLCEEVRSH